MLMSLRGLDVTGGSGSRCFGNPHAQCGNPANYGCIVRVTDVARLAARFVRGNQNQIVVVQLAPAAHVRISKLEEKNRPIMIAMPTERWNLFLSRVDLNERFWTIDPKSKKV